MYGLLKLILKLKWTHDQLIILSNLNGNGGTHVFNLVEDFWPVYLCWSYTLEVELIHLDWCHSNPKHMCQLPSINYWWNYEKMGIVLILLYSFFYEYFYWIQDVKNMSRLSMDRKSHEFEEWLENFFKFAIKNT